MHLTRLTILLLIFVINSTLLKSQDYERVYTAEMSFIVSTPQGSFKKNTSNYIYGAGLGFLTQVKKAKPLFIGIEMNFIMIGSETATVERFFNNFSEFWNSTTNSLMFGGRIFSRYYIDLGTPKLTPFVEFGLGTNWFTTYTSLQFQSNDESVVENHKIDMVGYYGGALGVSYQLKDNLFLTGKLLYNNGLSGKYYSLRKGNLGGEVTTLDFFDLRTGPTSMLNRMLGISYTF
jgi:hypothetical protein